MSRPDWDSYFLKIAEDVSARADCTRRKVGYVLVDTDNRIISTGYNGSLPGAPGCLEGACPRGRHFKSYQGMSPDEAAWYCKCDNPWPCDQAVAPGSSYDTGAGSCTALHAEQNALLYAFRSVKNATAYGTDWPCDGCMRLLKGARIGRIVTPVEEWWPGLS